MDKRNIKSEIMEKIGIDKIINKQMGTKDPEELRVLDEKDIERIQKKLKAEVEHELDERLDQEIEEQVERKMWEIECKAKLRKVVKRVGAVVAGCVALFGVVVLVKSVLKLIIYMRYRRFR